MFRQEKENLSALLWMRNAAANSDEYQAAQVKETGNENDCSPGWKIRGVADYKTTGCADQTEQGGGKHHGRQA